MAKILIKRGLEANRTGITPDIGEAIWTTDNKELWIGDGATAGGIKVTGAVELDLSTNYYTKTEGDTRYVEVAGDTMTGALVLSADPTVALGAATKQYVDGLIDSGMKSPDGYATNAAGDYPSDYKSTGSVNEGDTFYITSTAAGTVVGAETVNNGDLLVAITDNPGNTDANWVIVESNRDAATESVQGVVELATQAEVDAGADTVRVVTPATLNGAMGTLLGGQSIKDLSDVFTTMAPNDGEVLTWDNANSRWDSAVNPVGITDFTGLNDTPANYTGSAGEFAVVNAGETALEFTDTVDGGAF